MDVIPLLDKSQKGKIKFWAKYIRCMKNKADTTHLVQKIVFLNSQHILKKKFRELPYTKTAMIVIN